MSQGKKLFAGLTCIARREQVEQVVGWVGELLFFFRILRK